MIVDDDDQAGGTAGGRTIVIGITGPIGCGKSTIAAWLAELGATVIDADVVAREVVEPGEPALDQVLEAFGPAVRAPDGSLDRAALGRIVFADPDALVRLESIVHPAVRPAILERIAAASRDGAPVVAVEAIKLVEGGLAALCDEVWLVVCDPLVQRERLVARSGHAAAANIDGVDAAADTANKAAADTADKATADARASAPANADTSDAAPFDPPADTAIPGGGADVDARIAAQADIVDRLLPSASRVIDTSGSLADARAAAEAAYTAATSSV